MKAHFVNALGEYERESTIDRATRLIDVPVIDGYLYTVDGYPAGVNFTRRTFNLISHLGEPVYMEVEL